MNQAEADHVSPWLDAPVEEYLYLSAGEVSNQFCSVDFSMSSIAGYKFSSAKESKASGVKHHCGIV